MKCPKCSDAELKAIVVDAIEVDRCGSCDGIWFDPGELGTLLDREAKRVHPILGGDDEEDLSYRHGKCPRDGNAMMRVKSLRNSEVVLDTCGVCKGMWLDGGEFERIKENQPNIRLGDLV